MDAQTEVDLRQKLVNLCDMIDLMISIIGHDREVILTMSDVLKLISKEDVTHEVKTLATSAIELGDQTMNRHDHIVMDIAANFEPPTRGH